MTTPATTRARRDSRIVRRDHAADARWFALDEGPAPRGVEHCWRSGRRHEVLRMAQLMLFARGPQTLLDDASGRIVYTPDVVAPTLAQRWFDELRDGIAWRSGRRLMYEREVDVPRQRAHFKVDDPALPPALAEAATVVRAAIPAPFDSIGCNLYRDEHDSVRPAQRQACRHRQGRAHRAAFAGRDAALEHSRKAAAAARAQRRYGSRQPAPDELVDAVALRSRHPQTTRAGGAPHQSRIPRARSRRELTWQT